PAILPLALSAALAAPLAAQSCFVGDFGASLGYGTTDTVYPIRPIGFAFPLNGTTYTDIHVNDHGFVELSNGGVPAPLGSGSAALFTPTAANFTAGAPKIAPLYSDMTLAGGGECFLNATPTHCTVTWWNAQSYGIPSPRFSFQLVLEPNGIIRFVYGPGCTNNSTFGGVSNNGIAGVTPAGGVAAPAGVDLSSNGVSSSPTTYELFPVPNGFDLADRTIVLTPTASGYRYATALSSNCATATRYGAGCDGLGLGANGLPTLGHTGFKLRAEMVPAVSPIGLFAFGTAGTNPGLPLGQLLGMTGCEGYTNANIGIFTGSAVGPGPFGLGNICIYDLPIPSALPLVGATLSVQALSFSLSNPALLASSNGLELRLGVSGPAGPPAPRLSMVAIAPGTFQMGSTAGSPAEQPVRQVTISRPFWMGKYEVTQAQYQAVMGNNPSAFQGANAPNAAQRPVESLSWNDAVAYCQALTALEQAAGRVPSGYVYRLPTEAEWEYCCRAGTTTEWHTGTSLSTSQANFAGALASAAYPFGQTAVVGSYAPNGFGLHDMHGNVAEWVLDSYAPYVPGNAIDPFVSGGATRAVRSGSCGINSAAISCRSAIRYVASPIGTSGDIGFRVVLAPVAANVNPALGMVAIAPGTFQMGSMAGNANEQPVRQVTISQPFWMGKYEVTQAQYQAVMGNNPSAFQGANAPNAAQRPVDLVTWNNAMAYCAALNGIEQAAGRVPAGYQYRLPTEAEWEYCCRAGTTTEWNTGTSLSTSEANFNGALANAAYPLGQTSVVGSYAPNAFGLHDMHGNAWEWCLDAFAPYAPGPVTDPYVSTGPLRSIRGGGWGNYWLDCRSAIRAGINPAFTYYSDGFRVVLAPILVP
ncbi:MAG: SUMF1/EgtB/PvdO family nonheme iron enzyme, partial [Planctomycetota bacterium]